MNIYENEQDHLPKISEAELSDEQVMAELHSIKKELGDKLVVLGHHYQQDDVISLADHTGDSLQLAREAAKLDAEYIVFCGVHFMAETADMLSAPLVCSIFLLPLTIEGIMLKSREGFSLSLIISKVSISSSRPSIE